jgi:hypothetical protein
MYCISIQAGRINQANGASAFAYSPTLKMETTNFYQITWRHIPNKIFIGAWIPFSYKPEWSAYTFHAELSQTFLFLVTVQAVAKGGKILFYMQTDILKSLFQSPP